MATAIAALLFPVLKQSDLPIRLYLANVPLQDESLLVNLALEDTTNLYGAEIQLSYNPAARNELKVF